MQVGKSEICNAFPLPARPPQVSNAHLRLVRLTPADSGEYVCRVSGGSVPQEASFVVSVVANTSPTSRTSGIPAGARVGGWRVFRLGGHRRSLPAGLQSPIISIEPHSVVVRGGEEVSFRCHVHKGSPPLEITWKLPNNQLLGEVWGLPGEQQGQVVWGEGGADSGERPPGNSFRPLRR